MVIFVDCVSSLCAGLISDLILQFVSVQLQLLLRYRWFPRRLLKFTVQEGLAGFSHVKYRRRDAFYPVNVQSIESCSLL